MNEHTGGYLCSTLPNPRTYDCCLNSPVRSLNLPICCAALSYSPPMIRTMKSLEPTIG